MPFPPSRINKGPSHRALIPRYTLRTPELVMSIFDHLIPVTAGQKLRVWYNEDLENDHETDYNGRVRADVYGNFM